ncbi:MAG TPA: site-2 protease family protein [Chloroflexi bacterium]|nr:site-2 protease family protein [Chloroflexota bacterium]
MDQSIRLFSVRGIAVRMHLTFPLILVWAALQFGVLARGGMSGAVFGVLTTMLLFVIVVLHELGHSVAAQYYGVEVKQIVLLPLGGVAQLARIPEKPSQEFVIAIAGPAVNFGLALIFGVVAALAGWSTEISRLPALLGDMSRISLAGLFAYTFASNLLLGVFNLIPAFPMDGGRILRAALAARLPYPRATELAAGIGQALAWVMGIAGFLRGDFFWVLIALFVHSGATQERQLVSARSILSGLTVEQAFSRGARALAPDQPLKDAIDLTLNSFQSDFPICDGDSLIGMLTHARLIKALNERGPDARAGDVMERTVIALNPSDELIEAQQRLAEAKLDALPVIQGDRFLGILTTRDISEIYRLASIRQDLLRRRQPSSSEVQTQM